MAIGTWWKKRKPEPPFPEKLPHHTGKKRNKLKVPKSPLPPLEKIPNLDYFSPYNMTSSAKGLGLKECYKEGRHEVVKVASTSQRYSQQKRMYVDVVSWAIYCKRCGAYLDYRKGDPT